MENVKLGSGGPPGQDGRAAIGWRAITRVLRSWSEAFRHALVRTGHDVVTACYPSNCRVCDAPVSRFSAVLLCESCLSGPEMVPAMNLCSRCGVAQGWESARMAASLGLSECTMCRLAPPEFERAVAYAEYGDQLRDQLFLLKYQHQRTLGVQLLGARLAQAILRLRQDAASSLLVVPVPLYFDREQERGYNQSLLLAQGAVARLRKLVPEWTLTVADNVLLRTRSTPPLYSLSAKQRRSKLAGAFRVISPESVAGREVLLIDDVMTTGATTRECARALHRAGATKVWVATVARTQPFGSAWMDEAAINGPPLPSGVALWDGGRNTTMH